VQIPPGALSEEQTPSWGALWHHHDQNTWLRED
jgi:hypothetical protein